MLRLCCFSKYNNLIFKLTLLLQLKLYLCLSANHYGDCIPKKCGNLSITYPLYITDDQNRYCGYPGFEVSCQHHNFPSINISGESYVVKSIDYEEQIIQVVNSMLLDTLDSSGAKIACSGLLQHLNNTTVNNDKFKYSGNQSESIFLMLNCPEKVLQEIPRNWVICGAVGVYENETRLEELRGKCTEVVSVAYEGVRMESIREMLEEGFNVKWMANDCSTCHVSGGQCGYDEIASEFNCFCPDRTHARMCPPRKKGFNWLLLLALGVSTLLVMLIALVIVARRRIASKFRVPWTRTARGNQNMEAFLKIYGSLAPKRYKYSDIKQMTNSFKHKLGEGGYGTVYKGRLQDGRFVAVKKLKNLKGNGEEFINEVVSISRTNHVNVVSLLGFCSQGNKRALVYDFMPNGSLEKYMCHAGSKRQLPLKTLVDIAVGVARGLDYLHRGCNARILHFDIKPHNILLDQEYCPKISDFGLAKLSDTKKSMTSMLEARGTIGYIAPEVFSTNFGHVSHKSDVYSYWMMVLDMSCGRKNLLSRTHNSSEQYFPDWIYKEIELEEEVGVDEIIENGERGLVRKMILVGLWCIQMYPANRPSMNEVVEMLEGELESIKMPPRPQSYSPLSSGVGSFSTLLNTP